MTIIGKRTLRGTASALFCVFVSSMPAWAQQAPSEFPEPAVVAAASESLAPALPAPVPELFAHNVVVPLPRLQLHAGPLTFVPAAQGSPRMPERRFMLNLLTLSFEGLQAADAITTIFAMRGGATEQNPVMQHIASHPVRLAVVKASVTTASLLMTHRIVKRHRLAGMLLLAGLNSTLAIVVTRNVQVASGQ